MVAITDTAGALLQPVQREQRARSLRLEVDATGRAWHVGPQTDGEVSLHAGEPVLRLSPEASAALTGYTFSTEETAEGPRLMVLTTAVSQAPAELPGRPGLVRVCERSHR